MLVNFTRFMATLGQPQVGDGLLNRVLDLWGQPRLLALPFGEPLVRDPPWPRRDRDNLPASGLRPARAHQPSRRRAAVPLPINRIAFQSIGSSLLLSQDTKSDIQMRKDGVFRNLLLLRHHELYCVFRRYTQCTIDQRGDIFVIDHRSAE